jgi:hypothetical protein
MDSDKLAVLTKPKYFSDAEVAFIWDFLKEIAEGSVICLGPVFRENKKILVTLVHR